MRSILGAAALALMASTASAENARDRVWEEMATYLLKNGEDFKPIQGGWMIFAAEGRPGSAFWM